MVPQHIVVHLSKPAFIQATLATIAAYDILKKARSTKRRVRGQECYALLWGKRACPRAGTQIYTVDFITVDTHAESGRTWIDPSASFQRTMTDCMRVIDPSCRLLGEFHSHPYRDRAAFNGPGFSEDDRAEVEDRELQELNGVGMRVFLTASIYRVSRVAREELRHRCDNVFTWSVGSYKLYLVAYAAVACRSRWRRARLLFPREKGWPLASLRGGALPTRVTLCIGSKSSPTAK